MDLKLKECKKCTNIKTLNDFPNNINTKDGKSCWCKSCYKSYKKKYGLENRKELSKKHNQYCKDNRDIINKAQRKWNKKNPNYHNDYYAKNRKK